MKDNRQALSIFGALVADAASLGLHWLYDVDRLASVVTRRGEGAGFVPIDPMNYDGAAGYFAHGSRADGMLSQYGECLRLACGFAGSDGFNIDGYQKAFAQFFGPGGAYCGYIDRPTRTTLENIGAEKLDPSGADDDQLPAVTRIPALVAAAKGGDPSQLDAVVRITNDNDIAVAYASAFAELLGLVIKGVDLDEALRQSIDNAEPNIKNGLLQACNTDESDSVKYAGEVGRACHLPTAMPVAFHIMKRATSFQQAVETNILAGGDSCGRAIIVGSVMAARFGFEPARGIPLEWILTLQDGKNLWKECLVVAQG